MAFRKIECPVPPERGFGKEIVGKLQSGSDMTRVSTSLAVAGIPNMIYSHRRGVNSQKNYGTSCKIK